MIALGVHAVRPLDLACVLSGFVALLALFPQLLTIAGWSAATSPSDVHIVQTAIHITMLLSAAVYSLPE